MTTTTTTSGCALFGHSYHEKTGKCGYCEASIGPSASELRKARFKAMHAKRPRTSDSGSYRSGYRVYRDGSYREDFGSDR